MKVESSFNIDLSRMPEGVPARIGRLETASTDRSPLPGLALTLAGGGGTAVRFRELVHLLTGAPRGG
jgi:hypothetical protein